MPLPQLFQLIPPTLPASYCPPTWQNLANDLIGGTQLTFLIQSGNFIYNYGSTTPTPENRIFPWLNTTTGLWYTFQLGLWVAPVDPSNLVDGFRRIYKAPVGTPESAVWSLDSGDGTDPSVSGNVTAIKGAMWMIDHSMDGYVPIGAGVVPGSDPAQTIAFGTTGGVAQVTLDITQMPFHNHNISPGTEVDPSAPYANIATFQAGTDWRSSDSPSLKAGQFYGQGGDATTKATQPHANLQPSLAVWFLQHTGRRYYVLNP